MTLTPHIHVFTNPEDLESQSILGLYVGFIIYAWLIKSLPLAIELSLQSLSPPREVRFEVPTL